MREIMLTGVGGQGTVLAAKVLAQAALAKGWTVRTAETIGMAQRGGSVVSHVRMGDEGEPVFGPLIARGCADLIIAFEPAEAVRVLPYLASSGAVVTASTAVQPVTAALSPTPYRAADACNYLGKQLGSPSGNPFAAALSAPVEASAAASLSDSARDCISASPLGAAPSFASASSGEVGNGGLSSAAPTRLIVVPDKQLCDELGTRKALNMVLLGKAAAAGLLPFTAAELQTAMESLVNPRFHDLNRRALGL